ncbi:MAG: ABC transporter permease [Armatimonadota bacterium]|nr:ABC transporter permease [Armatimonadota bacterium]
MLSEDLKNNLAVLVVLLAFGVSMRLMWRSPVWGVGMRRIIRNRKAVICLVVLALFAIPAILDSIQIASGTHGASQSVLQYLFNDVAHVARERTYSAPLSQHEIGGAKARKLQSTHLIGTNGGGFDVLYLTLRGCRTAWIVGGFTLVIAIPIAIILGITSGYFGGWVDDVVQYLYVTLSSIPSILLLVSLMMVLGKGLLQICIALAVTEWVGLARYLRGETLKNREKEYVLAARAMGVHPLQILWKHIFPNVFHLVVISATLSFSGLVGYEAILTYLGVGVPRDFGSWGGMIDDARLELARDPIVWWNFAMASAALFILVLAANLFGDAVRDAFDPRLREG